MRIRRLQKNELVLMAVAYLVVCSLVGLFGCVPKPSAEVIPPSAHFEQGRSRQARVRIQSDRPTSEGGRYV